MFILLNHPKQKFNIKQLQVNYMITQFLTISNIRKVNLQYKF
ncbi:MAG: hypothetical protein JWR09_890 [Mucilaginibacter sp.]|nr:hypothetical protein [Mucilaginibacter sp.]